MAVATVVVVFASVGCVDAPERDAATEQQQTQQEREAAAARHKEAAAQREADFQRRVAENAAKRKAEREAAEQKAAADRRKVDEKAAAERREAEKATEQRRIEQKAKWKRQEVAIRERLTYLNDVPEVQGYEVDVNTVRIVFDPLPVDWVCVIRAAAAWATRAADGQCVKVYALRPDDNPATGYYAYVAKCGESEAKMYPEFPCILPPEPGSRR
ncbi:MAG: hypothetical protein ACYSUI_22110 [Planctomycetota bacterium]|jgi:hypothetical protein